MAPKGSKDLEMIASSFQPILEIEVPTSYKHIILFVIIKYWYM